MELKLQKATEHDAQAMYDMQVEAFLPLLNKYQDFETNPANEAIEKTIARINQNNGGFYKILGDNILIGAIRVFWKEESQFWISPMFILPTYQGMGLAQQVLVLIESLFPQAATWELATILEEERNCYLYEKVGYIKTGVAKKLSENATLIYYKKTC